jgi:ferredoxin
MVDNVVTIVKIEGECQWCTNCELVCPTGAIVCPFEVVFEEVQYERLENNL